MNAWIAANQRKSRKGMIAMGVPIDEVFRSAAEAGRQLVETGRMSHDTLQAVSCEIIPRDHYMEQDNRVVAQEQEKLIAR
jgi:hypothetical protein